MEIILLWIVMAVVCGVVGNSKGRSFFAYFAGGILCWPIALTVAICAKNKEAEGPRPA